MKKLIKLIHFNDVYNIEKSPKFSKVLAEHFNLNNEFPTFCFFSGDAFSPSIISSVLRGTQMIPILSKLPIDAACLGNHDLDFGLKEFNSLRSQLESSFYFLCSNARIDEKPMGNCREYSIIEKDSVKLLVLGIIEYEWMETLSTINLEDVKYEDFIAYTKRRVPELIESDGPFDAVVALSHMRMPNDYKLAEECSDLIDIVLGGHDHHYEVTKTKDGVYCINSGTDFEDFTVIHLDLENKQNLTTERVQVKNFKDIEPDEELQAIVNEITSSMHSSLDKVVGYTSVDLEARFSKIRTQETNISNLLAALMTRATKADVAILNAGSIRADTILQQGELTRRNLLCLLPVCDPLGVVEMTGMELLEALENGVSKWPAMEGRFPCVDGVRFEFDGNKEPGQRIDRDTVYIRQSSKLTETELAASQQLFYTHQDFLRHFEPIDLQQKYKVVTKVFVIEGKDGYHVFTKDSVKVIVHDEDCPLLPNLLRNLFLEVNVLQKWKHLNKEDMVSKAVRLFKRHSSSYYEDNGRTYEHTNSNICSNGDHYAIHPLVDGRITNTAL